MPKQYKDFMGEISKDELYCGLLAHGLLSEKLPPVFTSEFFFDYCQSTHTQFQDEPHKYIYYENMRNINVPRSLAIPNPMAYQRLCSFLRDNWDLLKTHFTLRTQNQRYRVSRIHIRKMYGKPELFRMNYGNWRIDGSPEVDISFGKRYMVKADISSCFPSMYTHALSWALATKEVAKQQRNDKSLWFNQVDYRTRRMTHDETHGLLIGPHASNLLAEVILVTIDEELCKWQFVRAIDDYTCFVDSYEEGQKFLTELGASLRAFDLSLNHKKTEISLLPLAVTEQWQRKLNALLLKTAYGKTNYILVRSFLDHAIELMHSSKENASILNYAIKILSGEDLTENAAEYCAKTIMNLSMLYPYLVAIMDEYVFMKYCKKCQTHCCVQQYAKKIYKNGLLTNNYELVAYALFFAIKYQFQIDEHSTENSIKSKDCVVLTLSVIYAREKGLIADVKILKQHARKFTKDTDSFDEFWLFLYETLPKTDLKGDWKSLKAANVAFVKPLSLW